MQRNILGAAIAALLFFPGLTISTQASAQEAQAQDGEQAGMLDKVVVTARRREETIQDVPVAVSAFTAQALEKLNIRDLADLDANVPNLTVYAARGSNSTLTAYIRGVGQSDPLWGVDPGVGLYMDDVYIARPQGALLDVFDVERVEVLRGPQGTLYGKNTIGGAIKYVSKPLVEEFNGSAQATIGNYGQKDLKFAIGGSVGDGAVRGRVALATLNNDGFGKNIITGDPVSDKDIFAVRASLGAYVNDDINFQLAFDNVEDDSGVRGARLLAANRFDAILTPTTGPFLPMDSRYDVRNGMPNVNETTLRGASLTANWRMNDDWNFKYIVAKRESDTETNIDFDVSPDAIADVKAFYNDEQVTNEAQLNYDGGGRARGVIGIYSFDGYAGGQVLNNFFNLSFGDTHGKVFTESLAVYADWTFDLTDRLALDLGARWTDEEKHAIVLNRAYSDASFQHGTTVAADFDKTVKFSNISPKISLDFKASDNVLLYALASRGFKSGGYNIRANAVAVPRSAEPFGDEQVDSFEIGSKMGLLDDRLFLNLSAFHNKYKDMQLSVFTELPGGGFFGDFTNAGEGTVQGVEAEWQFFPTEHFGVTGNVAWLDAKYDEYLFFDPSVGQTVNIAKEENFTNAPEFSGALNLEFRTPVGEGHFAARVGYSYQDDVVATTETLRQTTAPLGPFGRPAISQEAYGLLGASMIYSLNDHWTFTLQGSNLTDKEYMTTGYNLAQAVGVYTGFYGAPRQYSLSVRYDF